MKRKLTINFVRGISKLSSSAETLEVVLQAVKSQSSSQLDETYLPPPERRKVRLLEPSTKVVFEVTPSYVTGTENPIVYRLGWRRDYMGKLEVHDFLMPDKDVTFEDLKNEGFLPETFYLRESDLGRPSRVAQLDSDGNVVNARGETFLSGSEVEALVDVEAALRASEDAQVVQYVNTKTAESEDRSANFSRQLVTNLERSTNSTLATAVDALQAVDMSLSYRLDQLESGSGGVSEETLAEIQGLLETKADLVDGVLKASQIPEEVYASVVTATSNDNLKITAAKRGDIAVTPTDAWLLEGDDYSVEANWKRIAALQSGIQTINGKSEANVTLTASDVGARPDTPLTSEDISDFESALSTELAGYVKLTDGKVSTSLLGEDVARLEGTKIVNAEGVEIAVAGDVTSVNGQKGDVTVTPSSIGARPAGDIPIAEVTNLQNNLNLKVNVSDSRLTDARTPTAHASTHKSDGEDPLVLDQAQITGLPTALSNKATKQEFEDFKTLIEANLPENPEQAENAAMEFAAISIQAAQTSTTEAEKASGYLNDVSTRHTDIADKHTDLTTKYDDVVTKHGEVVTLSGEVRSDKESVDTSYQEVTTKASEVSTNTLLAKQAAALSITAAVDESGATLPEGTETPSEQAVESVKVAVREFLGTSYRDNVISLAGVVSSDKDVVTNHAASFTTRAQEIKDGTDKLSIRVEALESLSTVVEDKANKSHAHVSDDITDAAEEATPAKVARRNANGSLVVPSPQGLSEAAPKSYVDSTISTSLGSVESLSSILRGEIESTLGVTLGSTQKTSVDSSPNTIVMRSTAGTFQSATPQDLLDVANKTYVDATVSGVSSAFLPLTDVAVTSAGDKVPKRTSSGQIELPSVGTPALSQAVSRSYLETSLDSKLDKSEAVSTVTNGAVVRRRNDGHVYVPTSNPTSNACAVSSGYLNTKLSTKVETSLLSSANNAAQGSVVTRAANSEILVPLTPLLDYSAASKQYVDTKAGQAATASSDSLRSELSPLINQKLNASEAVEAATAGKVVKRTSGGQVTVPTTPSAASDAVSWNFTEGAYAKGAYTFQTSTSAPTSVSSSTITFVTG